MEERYGNRPVKVMAELIDRSSKMASKNTWRGFCGLRSGDGLI